MSEEHSLQILVWTMIAIVILIGSAFSIKHDYGDGK